MLFENCYKGKKILLTGHTGFKGSWMAIWLKELGAEVYGYGLEPYSEMDNFVTCNLRNQLHHVNGDVRNADKLKEYFNFVQPDIAFHLAAQSLVLLSYKDAAGTFETNLMGVVNFFEAVRSTPSVKVAINITSDKCYDNKEWIWGYRENDPLGGKDPYSASKGCAELITASYMYSFFKNDHCLVATARAGNVIGGGDWAENRIVPDYYRALRVKKKLLVRNPNAIRPWQHVLEPISGYLVLASKLLLNGRIFSGSWNFGPNETAVFSVKDLIEKMMLLHSDGGYTMPQNEDYSLEANYLKLDISKAINQLQWKPVLNFNETVEFTVRGYEFEMNNMTGILEERKRQIMLYIEKAKNKSINWAI